MVVMKVSDKISVVIVGVLAVLGLAACTPGDVAYCRQFGVAGTGEYAKCVSYYQQQTALFSTDRDLCGLEADATYPPYLYDYGHVEQVVGGGWGGRYYGGQTIQVGPDYRKNAEIDRLRMRIIEPCMQSRGWNSATDWQAGHHAVSTTPAPRRNAPPAPLPWLQ